MVKDLKDVFKKFNTDKKCRDFLIQQRWNRNVECVYCGHNKVYEIENGERFKCANPKCYKRFRVTVGSIFHASNIPLTTWFPAMYIISSHKKGISSVQLAKDLGVTQKTAWFMLHRIRKSLAETNPELLGGTNEIDEAYMGRKFASEYKATPPEQAAAMAKRPGHEDKLTKKGAVVGIYNREADVIRTTVFNSRTAEAVGQAAKENIIPGSVLYSDEAKIYRIVMKPYQRETVNHWMKEWARGPVSVNHVENFWSVMKRGIYGIYHQISYKHLQRYCDEFSYRYNSRHTSDGERFTQVFRTLDRPLSYKELVHGQSKESNNSQA